MKYEKVNIRSASAASPATSHHHRTGLDARDATASHLPSTDAADRDRPHWHSENTSATLRQSNDAMDIPLIGGWLVTLFWSPWLIVAIALVVVFAVLLVARVLLAREN
jgi:hypothetical protein